MAAQAPITVAIAHFEDLLALGLHALLDADPSVAIVAEDIAVDRVGVVLRALRPRVLILDAAALPELARVRDLSVQYPQTRLVLLGAEMSTAESAQLLAFGASACLSRSTEARDVRHAIHLASRGLQVMPRGAHDAVAAQGRDSLLTDREGDVLELLRQRHSNAEIALALQIGVETVRSHARSIYRKLGVSSRRALVALPTPAQPAAAEPPVAAPRLARHRSTPRQGARR